jgi:hypothetical protein
VQEKNAGSARHWKTVQDIAVLEGARRYRLGTK